MMYAQFSSMYRRNENVWMTVFHIERKADYGLEDAIVGYGWVARYTLQFLNAYLKDDPAARTFLKCTPLENGVPRHFMNVDYREAAGPPASFEGFRAEVGRLGFGRLAEIQAALQKEGSDFKLDEIALEDWASDLMAGSHFGGSIALLQLAVGVRPDSSRMLERLGDAYRVSGNRTETMASYRKALQKSPDDPGVQRKLREQQN